MKFSSNSILSTFSIIFLSSCMKDGANTRTCELTTGITPITQNTTILYLVSAKGSVYLNSITYQDISGPITLQRPALPFKAIISATAGTMAGMEVKGTAMEGEFIMEQLSIAGNDTSRIREVCAD